MSPDFDAVILAGGRGSRLGGLSKADLVVGGRRLLDRVLDAANSARRIVVVGDVAVPPGVLLTREDPPGTGPAAGVVAGLAALDDPAEWTLVLACDLPDAEPAVAALVTKSGVVTGQADGDAYCLQRAAEEPEWLLGIYRSASLRQAAADYGDPRNRSVRGMLRPLNPVLVEPDLAEHVDDLDTWADHARWHAAERRRQTEDRSQWRPFIERACAAVGVDPALVDEDAILSLTREVAHAGARPMAPVAAYVWGRAVGEALAAGCRVDADYLGRVLEDVATAAPVPPNPVPPTPADTLGQSESEPTRATS